MNDCNANRETNNLSENELLSSQHSAAAEMNRVAYHTSFSVPNALHNLSSLQTTNGYSLRESEALSGSNTLSSTPHSSSHENMYDVESHGEQSRVSI